MGSAVPARGVTFVWRSTEAAPLGEYVEPTHTTMDSGAADQPEIAIGDWIESSFELLHGTDVIESPDTLALGVLDDLLEAGDEWANARPSQST